MNPEPIFDRAARLLEGNFSSSALDRSGGAMTVFAAIRVAVGMGRDDPPVAYNGSSWPDLDRLLRDAADTLDDVVRDTRGRDCGFVVWSTAPERTEAEAIELLARASSARPDLVVGEVAVKRPGSDMPGQLKERWVICNQLGTIARGRECEVSDVLREVLPTADRTNTDIIRALDQIIDSEQHPWEKGRMEVHKELSRAWNGVNSSRYYTFDQFIDVLSQSVDLASISDAELERELETIKAASESMSDEVSLA